MSKYTIAILLAGTISFFTAHILIQLMVLVATKASSMYHWTLNVRKYSFHRHTHKKLNYNFWLLLTQNIFPSTYSLQVAIHYNMFVAWRNVFTSVFDKYITKSNSFGIMLLMNHLNHKIHFSVKTTHYSMKVLDGR